MAAGFDHLVNYFFGLNCADATLRPLDLFENSPLQVFEHQVDFSVVSKNLNEINNVIVGFELF